MMTLCRKVSSPLPDERSDDGGYARLCIEKEEKVILLERVETAGATGPGAEVHEDMTPMEVAKQKGMR